MADQLQLRGGTTTEHNTFTGASKEVTIDTTKKTAVVHDGSTAGGNPLMREDGSNSALALGSQGTPSLKFTGDTNTGIYSPGADQVAISTGGTGRLFVDASGKVGIGQAPPDTIYELHVQGDFRSTGNVQIEGSQLRVAGTSSAATPSIQPGNDADTGIFHLSTNTLGFSTTGSERLRITSTGEFEFTGAGTAGTTQAVYFNGSAPINSLVIDSSGRLGLGTSAPASKLHITGSGTSAGVVLTLENGGEITALNDPIGVINFRVNDSDVTTKTRGSIGFYNEYSGEWSGSPFRNKTYFALSTSNGDGGDTVTEKFRINSAGNVGIGTTSPGAPLTVRGGSGADPTILLEGGSSGVDNARIGCNFNLVLACNEAGSQSGRQIQFVNNTSQLAAIDSSGRLLVGTSTALDKFDEDRAPRFQVSGTTKEDSSISITRWNSGDTAAPALFFGGTNSSGVGIYTLVNDDEALGEISFEGTDGSKFVPAAKIEAFVDGTPGADDMPGRLVFSTTADSESSPTARMSIGNDGDVLIGATTLFNQNTSTGSGIRFANDAGAFLMRSGAPCLFLNRNTDDGTIVDIRQAGNQEGTISVSGSTVSYNGAHLSRWSQLPNGATREEILRGTVLSNIDEMCEWGEEDNEQLNRMKVSDVEGDRNVSGVFQGWDDDDDTYTNDFYCAMTGDFVIRIAQGTTVARGDLLMSAGDGTAKPQDDDIVRSKTIAKVTSTNISETYSDGSYCVPCVLMAC